MKTSKQARREAKELFQACMEGGTLNEDRVRRAVSLVIEQKPRGYFPMLSHFQRLVKMDFEKRSATVESAAELSADQQGSVKANLARIYGDSVSVQYKVNPALIGGLRIRVGSDVYDGSVHARLENLKHSF